MSSFFNPASSLYTHQVYIDYVADGTALALLNKWHEKHIKGTAVRIDGRKGLANINLKERFQKQLKRKKKNKEENKKTTEIGLVKIYIDAHGIAGSDSIYGNPRDKNFKVKNAKDLAQDLKLFIEENQIQNKAVIDLLSCGGGHEDGDKKSFAEKLHVELKKLGLDIPVVGRKGIIVVDNKSGKKKTIGSHVTYQKAIQYDKSFLGFFGFYNQSKAHQSKLIFDSDLKNPNEIRISDAYARNWTRLVFKMLEQEIKISKHVEKQALLRQWQANFKDKSDEEIYAVLSAAYQNPDSPLHARSGLSGIFYNSAKSAVSKLLNSGENILSLSSENYLSKGRPEV